VTFSAARGQALEECRELSARHGKGKMGLTFVGYKQVTPKGVTLIPKNGFKVFPKGLRQLASYAQSPSVQKKGRTTGPAFSHVRLRTGASTVLD